MVTTVWILWLLSTTCPAFIGVFPEQARCEAMKAHVQQQISEVTLFCEPARFYEGRGA